MTNPALQALTDSGTAAYLPNLGGTATPVVHAGMTGGEIWLLMPDDGFHLMDTRGLTESTSDGGLVTWTTQGGEFRLVLAPLIQCDELNRADCEAIIENQREHYAEPEGAAWLQESIADAEREVAGRA